MAEVGIAAAAAALGVSGDTVRRRIKRGELVSRRTAGGRVLVTVPDDLVGTAGASAIPAATTPAGVDPGPLRMELEHTRAMLGEVRRRAGALERQVERDAEEREQLRRLLANAQQQLGLLLPAPNTTLA